MVKRITSSRIFRGKQNSDNAKKSHKNKHNDPVLPKPKPLQTVRDTTNLKSKLKLNPKQYSFAITLANTAESIAITLTVLSIISKILKILILLGEYIQNIALSTIAIGTTFGLSFIYGGIMLIYLMFLLPHFVNLFKLRKEMNIIQKILSKGSEHNDEETNKMIADSVQKFKSLSPKLFNSSIDFTNIDSTDQMFVIMKMKQIIDKNIRIRMFEVAICMLSIFHIAITLVCPLAGLVIAIIASAIAIVKFILYVKWHDNLGKMIMNSKIMMAIKSHIEELPATS